MKPLWRLNKYLLKYKWYLLFGIVFTMISNVFVIIPAQLVRIAIDYVVESFGYYQLFDQSHLSAEARVIFLKYIVVFGSLILGMALLRGLFLFLIRQTIIAMSRLVEYDLKNEIYQKYQSLPLAFYRQNSTGDLMARITEDVSRVRMYVGPALMYGINLVVLFPMVIAYMLTVNVPLTIYSLLPLPVLSISIYVVNNMINERSEKIQRSLSNMSTFVQEAFSGIRVIKAFVREADSANDFQKASEDYKEKSIRLTKVESLFYPLILGLIGLSTIITAYVGGRQVISGAIGYGVIAEFILYVNMLTWPVTSLGWVTSIVQRAAASQTRINEFLDEKNTLVSTEGLQNELAGKIELDNVSFVYPESGIRALDRVSLRVEEGQSLAVIGTTGSGKSTLANLLMRMYDVTEGSIRIDGIDIRAYDISSLRRQIGYVPQDVFLFSDTIANNIGFGLPEEAVSEQLIEKVARDADVYENIVSFPQGFQTRLGERGITLSGGQKQRVSIARAIAKEPKVLLLDDCLSAVDTKTENAILNSLESIMKGRTSIIISHRVSSAKLADAIVVLDDGRVVEYGTHEELLLKKGVYAELYEKQTQSVQEGEE